MSNIRDFIYYDKSKVISIGSQLLEGIAESIQIQDKSNQGSKNITDLKASAIGQVGLNEDSSSFIANLINKFANAEVSLSTNINKSLKTCILKAIDLRIK